MSCSALRHNGTFDVRHGGAASVRVGARAEWRGGGRLLGRAAWSDMQKHKAMQTCREHQGPHFLAAP